jgi:hypothetical protein
MDSALLQKIQITEEEKTKVMELSVNYPNAGITINDSYNEALAKTSRFEATQPGETWAEGTPTSYKEWQLAGSPGTYQEWLKKETGDTKLDILDVSRYQELYPNAGITVGDTETSAEYKIFLFEQLPIEIERLKNEGKTQEEIENKFIEENGSISAEEQNIINEVFKKGWVEKVFDFFTPKPKETATTTESTTEKTTMEKMGEIGQGDVFSAWNSFFGLK